MRALRLSDGGQAWDTAATRPGKTYGPPALKDGVLYAVEKDLGLVAFGTGSGKPRWAEKSEEGPRADHVVHPVVGSAYAYTYSQTDQVLRAVGLTSHTTEQLYKTSGTRFTAHEKSRMVIASGARLPRRLPPPLNVPPRATRRLNLPAPARTCLNPPEPA